jgi:PQQ-dependent dehydrogenase (methanol/ethanol family)
MSLYRSITRAKDWLAVLMAAAILGMLSTALANESLLELEQDEAIRVMPTGNYAGWNYSPLDQITTDNVQDLEVAWTFQTGVTDSHEASPIVVNDTMYILTPKPNTVYAIDLAQQGFVKWSWRPELPNLELSIDRACCGGQSRGFVYADGRLFLNTLDGRVFSLDAETGEVLWTAHNANLGIAETNPGPPLVVNDNVIVGIAGGEFGVRGHITAYNIDTGEQKWRFYSMGPDEEVGIGDRFAPVYPDDQVENPALDSWYQDSWKRGGGTVWGWFTYDPELNMFYYGTGNCGPWNPDYRRDPATAPGLDVYSNKYCASLLARDADTGELIWAYSLTPQDQWDYDEPNINLLVDLEIDGEMHQTLLRPARNGFFYVFDRATGELLVEPWKFTDVNWAESIDLETGRPVFNMDKIVFTGQPVENICPRIAARNWENDTYSPDTGLVYFTAQTECMDYQVVEVDYVPGQGYRGREYLGAQYGEDGNAPKSILQAWNPATGELAWSRPDEDFEQGDKPILSTAGGLLFKGNERGHVEAVDAMNGGESLWQFRTGSGFNGSPITYLGPDGEQYIAVIASSPPDAGQIAADAPPDEGGRYARAGATLYVFHLGD